MITAFVAGVVLGVVFFGGLNWSVSSLSKVKYPALFMFVSLALRMGILIFGFYLLKNGSYLNMPLALSSVIAVRSIMIWKVRKKGNLVDTDKKEEGFDEN